jgi:hypothetical protein
LGAPLGIHELFDGSSFLTPIVEDTMDELGKGIANRMIHPPVAPHELRTAMLSGKLPTEALHSHCLDTADIEALREGIYSLLLIDRTEVVRKVIADHVQDGALFGFRDGPAPATLLDDDDA